MFRRLILVSCIQVLLLNLVWAQSPEKISGIVTNEASGEPVGHAAVLLEQADAGTFTDETGHFSLDNIPAGWYTLQISHIGYHTAEKIVQVSRDGKTHLRISLKTRNFWSDSVLVEDELAGSRQIHIDKADITQSLSSSLAELLNSVPQVMVLPQGGSGSSGLSIHGSNTDQVLVLLDGIPLNNPLTGEVDLREISTAQIESIDITTSGSSAEYGGGAFAGVIEIHSLHKSIPGVETDLSAGNYGFRSATAGLNGVLNQWSYSLTGNRRTAENDYSYSYGLPDGTPVSATRENAGFEAAGLNGGVRRMSTRSLIQVRGFYLDTRQGLPGRVFQWTPYATSQTDRFGFSGQYVWSGSQSRVDVSAQYGGSLHKYVNQPPENAPIRFRQVPAYRSEYQHNSFRGKVNYQRAFSERLSGRADFSGGTAGFREQEKTGSRSAPIQASQNNYGVGAGFHLSTPVKGEDILLVLSPSIRYNQILFTDNTEESAYPFFSYSLRTELRFTRLLNSALYTLIERSFRPPTYGDLFYQDFRVNGNADLRPEKSRGYYIGVESSIEFPLRATLRSELFRKEVTDQIIWLTGSFGNYSPANTDSYITGQTISADWSVGKNLLFGQFYFEHILPLDKTNEHTVLNKLLPFRPEFQWQGSIGTQFQQFRLEYFHRFQGIRYSNRANTKQLQPFNVGDLIVRYTLPLQKSLPRFHFQAGLRLENLWNTPYEIVHRMPEPGREWRVTLQLIYNP